MTVRQPNTHVLRDQSDRNAFSGTDQNRVALKWLSCRIPISFENPDKGAVYVHGMKSAAAVVVKDDFLWTTDGQIGQVRIGKSCESSTTRFRVVRP